MARIKGSPKTGGRQPGGQNKMTKAIKELLSINEITTKIQSGEMASPLSFLLEVMNDQTQSMSLRVDCAKTVTKYTHKAMPQQTELIVSKETMVPTLTELYKQMDE